MKRWMALILTVCMLVVSIPAMATQSEDYREDYWEDYWIDDSVYFAETTLYGSSENKRYNIQLAVEALDGTAVYYGELFSFNETVGERSAEAGYLRAENGRGTRVRGGGVSQLATTLYLALRDVPYTVIEPFMCYGDRFADWYVENGSDAVVTDYSAGHDFSFTSEYDGVIYISAWMDEDYLYCMLTLDEGSSYGNRISRSSTPLFGSDNKLHNIELAGNAINGIVLERGDSFSFNDVVGPRTAEMGFYPAENGRGVRVYGGGVAQVASTIYLAVKELDCIVIDPIRTYGERFTDGYVADPNDAIVTDYNAGTDFSFTYWGYGVALVSVYSDGDRLVCEIYEF